MTTRASRTSDVVRRSGARRRKKRFKSLLLLILLVIEAIVAFVLVFALVIFYKFSVSLPNVETLTGDVTAPVATTIWSQDGVLLGKLEVENRLPIPLDEMSKNIRNATIAIEDHRFYEHPGVDVQGIVRAAWANLRHDNPTGQGGSTLTQQLVRNVDQFGLSKEKRYSRKVREALIALRVEQVYSKNEILQLYLNNIYYGAGAYGIQAASKTYFGKSAYKLDLAEAALLAGLPQRPNKFTPFDHRTAALERRDEVLDRMLEYGYCTRDEYEQAKAEKPRLMPRPERRHFDFKAPYFVTYVLKNLAQRYGTDFIYSGLKIETTLNWKMQQMAEHALYNGLDNASDLGANQGALVCLDNHTGYIRAMVGGRNFRADQFNAVTQGKRQPGSSFKVFDYSAAFDTGVCNLNSAFPDEPIPYPHDPQHRVVKNYGGGYSHADIDCLSAITHSVNTVAVQVARAVGIRTVIAYARRMGITTELAPYLPTALGASAVRPLDLCSAYSIFPNHGSRALPMDIVHVVDADGNLIEEHLPQTDIDVLKPETVDQMNTAFEAVVTSGTGTMARGDEQSGIVDGAHGKTGTTSDNRDAWFAGYTPELSAAIWVASVHRGKHKHLTYASMPGATGGHLCAPIWHNFMIQAVPEQRKFKLTAPSVVLEGPAANPGSGTGNKPQPRHPKQTGAKPPERKADLQLAASQSSPVNPSPPAGPTPPEGAPSPAPTGDGYPSVPTALPDGPAGLSQPDPGALPATPSPTPRPRSNASNPPPARIAPAPADPEMVTVEICVDSNDLATRWCDATRTIRVTTQQAARMHRCRIHHAPPGEN